MQLVILCFVLVIASLLAFLVYQNLCQIKSSKSAPLPEGQVAQAEADRQHKEMQNRLMGLEATLGETKVELAGASARCDAAKQACEETQQRHDRLMQTHQHAVEEHQAKVQEHQTKIQSVEATLGTSRVALASMQANYDSARRSNEEFHNRVNTLTIQLDELRQQQQNTLQQLSTVKAQAEGLQKQAQAQEQTIERVNKQLTDKSSSLESASQDFGVAQEKCRQQVEQIKQTQQELISANTRLHEKTTELLQIKAQLQTEEQAADRFKAISSEMLRDTLEQANNSIKGLTENLTQTSSSELQKHAAHVADSLKPLQDQLDKYDQAVQGFKTSSHDLFGQVKQQIGTLKEAEKSLHNQAQALTSALSNGPKVRGNYGELALKRLVEYAGMMDRCHFDEQDVQQTADGKRIPDMVFKLPGNQAIVVDAKAVMNACQLAQQAESDAERNEHLLQHCRNVKSRVDELHSKKYASLYAHSIEVVVLFLPAEHLYASAMENDPNLTEYAMNKGIIVCGPNTLLVLLKTANHLWKQASIEEEAQKVARLGADIYKAACTFLDNYIKLGKKVEQLVEAYNAAGGSLDGNLIPKGRELAKMKSLGVQEEIAYIAPVEAVVRSYRSEEARTVTMAATASAAE